MHDFVHTLPCLIEINKHFYECEYDHKSIDILESITETGFYNLYEHFVFFDDLSLKNTINLIAVSVLKNHGITGMQKVKAALIANPEMASGDLASFKSYCKNLLPDLIEFNKKLNITENKNLHSDGFYNFEDAYGLAKNCLGWSDFDFWSATPRKFCFALASNSKFLEEKEKFKESVQQKNCINLLNGIKKML